MTAGLDWGGGNQQAVLPSSRLSDSSVKTLSSLPHFSLQSPPPPPTPPPVPPPSPESCSPLRVWRWGRTPPVSPTRRGFWPRWEWGGREEDLDGQCKEHSFPREEPPNLQALLKDSPTQP